MPLLSNSSYYQPSGTEARRTVTASESAPASAAAAVDCRGALWAYVRVDTLNTFTSGTLSIYLAADADEVPQLYDEVALDASKSTDIPVAVGGVSSIAARVTALTGTSVRVTIRLAERGPAS